MTLFAANAAVHEGQLLKRPIGLLRALESLLMGTVFNKGYQ